MKTTKAADWKLDRYSWTVSGDRGVQRQVNLDDLKVDPDYQRNVVSEDNTLAIARSFSWVAFNTLVVMQRDNGDMFVVDGLQRLSAARRRGDIKSVPCRVFKSEGKEHEALAFNSLNVNRRTVDSYTKFKAAVVAKHSPEAEISEWLADIGMRVDDTRSPSSLRFPAVLVSQWTQDAEACKRALLVQREVIGDERPDVYPQKGFFWLIRSGVDVESHITKMKSAGGKPALLRAIRAFMCETNQAGSYRICGLGLLKMINFKRKRKIRVADASSPKNAVGGEE
jgi:hypothetical protein